jgi:hypothetical protein
MLTRTLTAAVAVALALALMLSLGQAPGVAADNKPAAADQNKAAPSADAPHWKDMKTVQGQIVNLQWFLTLKEAPIYRGESDDRSKAERIVGTLAEEVPIGLWVKESNFLDQLVPGRPVYLIIFDPEKMDDVKAYKAARKLTGQMVTLRGRVFEREGIQGILVQHVEAVKTAEAGQ